MAEDVSANKNSMSFAEMLAMSPFISDEMEGSQMVNLFSVDACANDAFQHIPGNPISVDEFLQRIKEIEKKEKPTGNRAIIEFCDDNSQYEAEEYELYIKPGQQLTDDTIIGSCKQDGIMKPIKSIFSEGAVEAEDETCKEFKRLYKKYPCNRHVIIKDYQVTTDIDVDSEKLIEMINDFSQSTSYFNLLTDVMNYCALPEILTRRKKDDGYYAAPLVYIKWKDGNDIYSEWKEHIDETIKNFKESKDVQVSADDIKSTNGDSSKIEEFKDRLLAARNEFISGNHIWSAKKNGIIELWQKLSRTQEKVRGDHSKYSDCRGLGVTFYLELLGRVDLTPDDAVTHKVFDTISSIATCRNSIEKKTPQDVANWINAKFKKDHPLSIEVKDYDIVSRLDYELDPGSSYVDVYTWLSSNSAKDDYAKLESCRVIANLYMYYKNSKDNFNIANSMQHSPVFANATYGDISDESLLDDLSSNRATDPYEICRADMTSSLDYYKLTVAEAAKLRRLWEDIIQEYNEKYNPEKLIKTLIDYVSFDYAEWPQPAVIWIDNQKYTYYYFDNIDAWKKRNRLNEDPDIGDVNVEVKDVPDNSGYEIPKPLEEGTPFDEADLDHCKTTYTIHDHEYWVRYFILATIVSLPYLATGIVIAGAPILLPGIFLALKTINIKCLNLVLVVGLAIRGICILPIVLWVNTDSQNLSALTPLVVALNKIKILFDQKIDELETLVPDLADTMISTIEADNDRLTREIKELEIQAEKMKALHFQGKELIARQLKSAVQKINPRQSMMRKEDLEKIKVEE